MKHINAEGIEIPDHVKAAVAAILEPYVPDLTKGKLERMLRSEEELETLLTKKEAAKHLGVSLPTIDRMLAVGQLTRCKIRNSVRIPMSSLAACAKGGA